MKKALIVHNQDSGRGNFAKKLKYVENELASCFDEMLFLSPKSKEEAKNIYRNKAPMYDVLIVIGGDGTLNFAINQVISLEKKPIMGYINSGTLGDAGKNFGVKRNLKRSLDIIKKGNVKQIDIGKVSNNDGNMYFLYTLCAGAYSSLSYTVKRKNKKRASHFAYYFSSIKEMFKKRSVQLTCKSEEIEKTCMVPFILIMNGKWMGGFKLNKDGNLTDGKFECYLPKQSFLNGILRFLPFKKEKPIEINNVSIEPTDGSIYWCFDGEKGLKGKIFVEVIKGCIPFFAK